jgi:hypothetical protein
MKFVDEDEIFYFYSGDDIRRSYTEKLDVYNTEFKFEIKFTNSQLEYFMKKISE